MVRILVVIPNESVLQQAKWKTDKMFAEPGDMNGERRATESLVNC